MAHAYTPGLKVTPRIRHRARRLLPIEGDVLVNVGDRVRAEDVVAQTFMPGDVHPVNLANVLSVPPGEVPESLLVELESRVEPGDLLARSKGIFGMFKKEYRAKVGGTVESVSNVTGQLVIRGEPVPIQVLAFLAGEVVEVLAGEGCEIVADVGYVQGIFGIGGEAYGSIQVVCKDHTQELTEDLIPGDASGKVLVGGARMTGAAVRRAIEAGASAVVSGGMDDQDLRDIMGHDLGVAVTGSERIGTTLIITEGFGEIAMARRTFDLLSSWEGHDAAVNGATQIRAGVMRPEIVVPLSEAEQAEQQEPPHTEGFLESGAAVRIIRDPYFGILGTVDELPPEPQVLDSGSKARVVVVRAEAGQTMTVPRANVEIIEA